MLGLIEQGKVNFGLIGSDKFNEKITACRFWEVGNLACRFVLAAKDPDILAKEVPFTVASSYPRAFTRFLGRCPMPASFGQYLSGKVENAPDLNLAEATYDICESGESLKTNGLTIVKEGDSIQLGGVWLDKNQVAKKQDVDLLGYLRSLATISSRAQRVLSGMEPQSYSEKLLGDQNERIKKFGSETAELIREECRQFDELSFIGEAADVLYSLELMVAARGLSFNAVLNELAKRNSE